MKLIFNSQSRQLWRLYQGESFKRNGATFLLNSDYIQQQHTTAASRFNTDSHSDTARVYEWWGCMEEWCKLTAKARYKRNVEERNLEENKVYRYYCLYC